MQDRGVEQKGGEADGGHALVHEVGNDTVKVDSVVEAKLGEVHKITGGDGHLIDKNKKFDSEAPQARLAYCSWVAACPRRRRE